MPPRLPLPGAIAVPTRPLARRLAPFCTSSQLRADKPNDADASVTSRVLDLDSGGGGSGGVRAAADPNQALRSILSGGLGFNNDNNNNNNNNNAAAAAPGGRHGESRGGAGGFLAGTTIPRTLARARASAEEELKRHKASADVTRHMYRRWATGDVYAPRDMTRVELGRFNPRSRDVQTGGVGDKIDLVDVTGVDPLDMYANFSVISQFMGKSGRIIHQLDSGLRAPNQRRMAKAIRRAVGLGIHPSVHRHPEILMREKFAAVQKSTKRMV